MVGIGLSFELNVNIYKHKKEYISTTFFEYHFSFNGDLKWSIILGTMFYSMAGGIG